MKETIEQQLTAWAKAGFQSCFPDDDLSGANMNVVPTAEEVRAHVRTSVSRGVLAESPPLVPSQQRRWV